MLLDNQEWVPYNRIKEVIALLDSKDLEAIAQMVKTIVKEEISQSEHRMAEKIEGVETKMAEKIEGVETRMTEKIEGVETRMTEKIEGVETRMAEKIEGVETRMTEKVKESESRIMKGAAALMDAEFKKHFKLLEERQEAVLSGLANEDDLAIIDGRLDDLETVTRVHTEEIERLKIAN